MIQALLFVALGLLMGLFAFAAAGAGEYVVAVPASLLALWLGDNARHAVRRHRRRERT